MKEPKEITIEELLAEGAKYAEEHPRGISVTEEMGAVFIKLRELGLSWAKLEDLAAKKWGAQAPKKSAIRTWCLKRGA